MIELNLKYSMVMKFLIGEELTLSFNAKPSSDHRSKYENNDNQTNEYDDFFLKKSELIFPEKLEVRECEQISHRMRARVCERGREKSTRNCRIFILFVVVFIYSIAFQIRLITENEPIGCELLRIGRTSSFFNNVYGRMNVIRCSLKSMYQNASTDC